MHKFIRQLGSVAALVSASLLAQVSAQASTVIDFEAGAPTLYLPGDSFVQSGFLMTTGYDFGTVDTAGALGDAAPSGNATQFYFNSNDGYLMVSQTDGSSFSLDGFSAAFVPLVPAPNLPQTSVLMALGITDTGDTLATYFNLGASSNHPSFLTFENSTGDFSRFSHLSQVYFFACAITNEPCDTATENNAQFAIDDILVTAAVPEPSTTALLALGLLGGMVTLRRRNVADTR